MLARATGLFSVYRDYITNASGDEIADLTNPLYVDVPLALHNFSVVEDPPTTARPRTIRAVRGRASIGTDLQAEDRILNQATGEWFVVDTVVPPLSSTRNSDVAFSVHRVN
jgi:hypothetical protein